MRSQEIKWLIVSSLVASVAMGCSSHVVPPVVAVANTVAAPPSTSSPHASKLAEKLRFVFVSDSSDAAPSGLFDAMRAKVEAAGFTLVNDPKAPHDASLRARVKASHGGAAIAGGSFGAGMEIELAVVHADQPIDWFTVPIADDGDPKSMERAIDAIVGKLADSTRLDSLVGAVNTEANHTRLENISHADVTAISDERTREELAWNPAALRHCRNAHVREACDPLAAFLQTFPHGEHADVARATLDQELARFNGRTSAGSDGKPSGMSIR